MLDAASPRFLHLLQNAALIALSLFLFAPDLYVLASCYVLQLLGPSNARRRARATPGFQPQKILVTGVGMSKGLALARTFYLAGHDVVGADFEPWRIPVIGRVSRALKRFHPLPLPGKAENLKDTDRYKETMLKIVRDENITLWVSCSGVANAVDDARMMQVLTTETQCRAIQLSESITTTLDDKGMFNRFLDGLKLPAPEAHVVRSRNEVHRILSSQTSESKSYILKSIAMNDASRSNLTRLPRKTLSDTYSHVAQIPINPEQPHILQEFVSGSEYCTHALVINNTVQTFVACPSSDLLMHYEALPASSPLHQAFLKFTQEFVHRTKEQLTGHLSFDFIVAEYASESGVTSHLYPIECNPRAHTAVALFNGLEKSVARKYLAAPKQGTINGVLPFEDEPIVPENPLPVYWLGHDLVSLVLHPIVLLLTFKMGPLDFVRSLKTFIEHVLFWKEGTFELWDPIPLFWLYHVYWPAQIAVSIIFGQWWSRVNVSTTKKFSVV